MPDTDGYPTPSELRWFWKERLTARRRTKQRRPMEVVEHIKSIWWMPNWGFKLRLGFTNFPRRKKIWKLELHTGGWSGNESIISELRRTMFWFLYWEKSIRGGHYWFEIPLKGT